MTIPVAFVTGASSGIGAATALELLARGYTVYGGARRTERMQAELAPHGVRILALDLTDDASMTAAVDRVLAEQGRIDVLVNNAGYGSLGALEDVPVSEARRQVEVNLFGLARLIQLVLPTMRAQHSGTIVNVASIGGKIATPLGSWYHATKYAVEGLSDALRLEVAPFGIRVVLVEPGAIRTEWGGIATRSAIERSGTTAYAPIVKAAEALLNDAEASFASSPTVVARAIGRAAQSRRPRSRYAVGGGAKPILYARRVLPDPVMDAIMRRTAHTPRSL